MYAPTGDAIAVADAFQLGELTGMPSARIPMVYSEFWERYEEVVEVQNQEVKAS